MKVFKAITDRGPLIFRAEQYQYDEDNNIIKYLSGSQWRTIGLGDRELIKIVDGIE